jgi:dephospho-CoA kinase
VPTVAVIGGIGCGKSTVTRLLNDKGAAVVDADVIAREVVEAGSPVLDELVGAFGAEILFDDGRLDRAALARLAFAEASATAAMNKILHPAIGVQLLEQVRAARDRADVVVVAIPLYRPEHREVLAIDVVVCVDCPPEVALERLVADRGLASDDARARMAAQLPRAERCADADEVLDNSMDPATLRELVDALWDRLAA